MLHAAGRGRDRLRVARRDRDLGPQPALALAHPLGDVGGEHLGAEGLAEDDLVDRLADDFLEARHVDAGLARIEVDEALEIGVVEVLRAVGLDPDHLLDAGHADPREAHLGVGVPDCTSGVVEESGVVERVAIGRGSVGDLRCRLSLYFAGRSVGAGPREGNRVAVEAVISSRWRRSLRG